MVTEVVFKWTKVIKFFKCGNYRRKYNAVYCCCVIFVLIIIVLLQCVSPPHGAGVMLRPLRSWLPLQRTSSTNTSIAALNADLNNMIHRLVEVNAENAAHQNTSAHGQTQIHQHERAATGNRELKVTKPVLKKTMVKDGVLKSRSSPLLVLFSSWEYSREKLPVHGTVMRLWAALSKDMVRTVVYSSNETLRSVAAASGWQGRHITKVNPACEGPPILGALFTDAFENFRSFLYGYANADIVFGDGLVKTINFIKNNYLWHAKPVLIVGRRHNFPFHKYTVPLDSPSDVNRITELGKLVARSTDYFFTNILFPWHELPRVRIGRPFVVRTVIGYAFEENIDIIDATNTIEAVHLTTTDGVDASWHTPGVFCNKRLLKDGAFNVPLKMGHCECARLETHSDAEGHIMLRSRDPDNTICK